MSALIRATSRLLKRPRVVPSNAGGVCAFGHLDSLVGVDKAGKDDRAGDLPRSRPRLSVFIVMSLRDSTRSTSYLHMGYGCRPQPEAKRAFPG